MRSLASIVLISAIATSAFVAYPAPALAPFATSVRAAERIVGAFASLSDVTVDPTIAAAAARRLKSDLLRPTACANAVWPDIDAECLTTADGRAASHVRSITIGSRDSPNTIVLVRIPVAELAQR